jgi:hypothetical protein
LSVRHFHWKIRSDEKRLAAGSLGISTWQRLRCAIKGACFG